MTALHEELREIFGFWTHVHEEDRGDILVFHKGPTEFPPSRGRLKFTLGEKGVLLVWTPGPNDQEVRSEGYWGLDLDRQLLEFYYEKPTPGRETFEIVSLILSPESGERLILRRLPGPT